MANRRDTIIQFEVANNLTGNPTGVLGASTCFYPGTSWIKKVNQLDCTDEVCLFLCGVCVHARAHVFCYSNPFLL